MLDPSRTQTASVPPVDALQAAEGGATSQQLSIGHDPADVPRFAPPAQEGELGRLGRYRILKRLGAGGMGAVYLAHDDTLDRRLALKVMLPKFASNPQAKARFLREARTAALVRSDHVIAILDVDEIDGFPFIAMEFLQGIPLDRYLSAHPRLSIPQVVRFGLEVTQGLAAAHAHGLVHRDIKPANLFLEAPKGRVKVLDFGLAKETDPGEEAGVTRTGQVVGTPAYMSPEQARGEAVDSRSDLFSLGVVLYRLATGQQPFRGPTPMAVLMSLGLDDPTPVGELNPAVPPSLAGIIHRLLAKRPADRPQTAGEVHAVLVAVEDGNFVAETNAVTDPDYVPIAVDAQGDAVWERIEDESATPGAVASSLASDSRKSNSFPWMIVAGMLAVVVAVGLLVAVLNYKPPKPEPDVVKSEPEPQKTPPQLPEVSPNDLDRKAAETLRQHSVTLHIQLANGGLRSRVTPTDPLPAERFTITNVVLPGSGLPPGFSSDVLVPAVVGLRDLTTIGHPAQSYKLARSDIPRLAEGAFAALLTELAVEVPLTVATLDALKRFPNLQWIVVDASTSDDDALARLSELPALNHLILKNLGVSRKIDPRTIVAIGKKSLLKLSFFTCRISGDELGRMVAGSPRLFDLRFMQAENADGLMPEVSKLAALAGLHVNICDLTDAGLKPLEGLTKLRSLQIARTKVTMQGALKFKLANPECQIVFDGYDPKLDPERVAAEWVLAKSAGGVTITGPLWVTKVADLPTGMLRVTGFGIPGTYLLTDADLDLFAPLTGLTSFGASNNIMTNDGFEKLSKFPAAEKITTLTVNSRAITEEGLLHLTRFRTVSDLNMSHTAFAGEQFAVLHELQRLNRLFLDGSQVTDAGLNHLAGHKSLTSVELRLSQRITDDGLKALAEIPGLTYLGLAGTKITDKGLQHLTGAKKLKSLRLHGTKVTPEGVALLRKALPNCVIESDFEGKP